MSSRRWGETNRDSMLVNAAAVHCTGCNELSLLFLIAGQNNDKTGRLAQQKIQAGQDFYLIR